MYRWLRSSPENLNGAAHFRIARHLYFITFRDADALVENLLLQTAGDPIAVGQPFAYGRLNGALRDERRNFSTISGHLKAVIDLVLLRVFRGETGDGAAGASVSTREPGIYGAQSPPGIMEIRPVRAPVVAICDCLKFRLFGG